MVKHTGGQKAGKGMYWNFSKGKRIQLTDDGVLPGDNTVTYYRLTPLTILLLGPIFGLAYAAFLPFIGIAIIGKLAVQKVFPVVGKASTGWASFWWRPAEAYLAGKKKKEKEKEK